MNYVKNIVNLYKKNIIFSSKYDNFVNKEIMNRLIDHLDYINLQPKFIVSCLVNRDFEKLIKNLYKKSILINLLYQHIPSYRKERNKSLVLDNQID